MAKCLIGLGSNLGDPAEQLNRAVDGLARLPGTRLVALSAWHETTAVGGPVGQAAFLNGAALLSTSLDPRTLLAELQRLEAESGRVRQQRWGPRSLDLDVLLYDQLEMNDADLEIPHPRMHYRRFVLAPAAEAAPWMVHPSSGWVIQRLLASLGEGRQAIAVAAEAEVAEQLIGELTRALGLSESSADAPLGSPPTVIRWPDASHASTAPFSASRRPKLILATDSAGTDRPARRRMLQLPADGPIAWMAGDSAAELVHEVLAAIHSVWPELAARNSKAK